MTVIAFTAFVIISQHTFAVDYVSETIFVRMLRWQNWLGNTPDSDFCECVWGQDDATTNESGSLHVGYTNNTLACCQCPQQLKTPHILLYFSLEG
ncbi:unknown protein [Microcystis aeruginosa NIES-843]|uniref:Uncharacterized protein n=1 Tax=Microcystis aeruginosa (strain NIES-843 / IAM M-2473) TaxID=449447 RepID=B0JVC9_MICAN|nr:unknown protein [Microcystis aeruginosa NIES-843]